MSVYAIPTYKIIFLQVAQSSNIHHHTNLQTLIQLLGLWCQVITSNSGSRQGPVVGSCEHDNEFSRSTKAGYFFSSWEPTCSSRKTLIHGVCNLYSYLYEILTYLLDLLLTDLFSALLSWSLSTRFLNGDGVLDKLCENWNQKKLTSAGIIIHSNN